MPKTVKMLKDFRVSPNGFDVEMWRKDELREDIGDDLADDLTHPLTLAAVHVTGNKKADEAAELEAIEAQEQRDRDAAIAKALDDASAQAALDAARNATANA